MMTGLDGLAHWAEGPFLSVGMAVFVSWDGVVWTSLTGGRVLCLVVRDQATAVGELEAGLGAQGYGWATHPSLGYLTACPSHVGTGGFRVTVIARVPLLARWTDPHDRPNFFRQLMRQLELEMRWAPPPFHTHTHSVLVTPPPGLTARCHPLGVHHPHSRASVCARRGGERGRAP